MSVIPYTGPYIASLLSQTVNPEGLYLVGNTYYFNLQVNTSNFSTTTISQLLPFSSSVILNYLISGSDGGANFYFQDTVVTATISSTGVATVQSTTQLFPTLNVGGWVATVNVTGGTFNASATTIPTNSVMSITGSLTFAYLPNN